MIKKLFGFLLLFLLPLVLVDAYIQYIASPVHFSATKHREPNLKIPTRSTVPLPQKAPTQAKDTTRQQPLGCKMKTSTIYFKDYQSNELSVKFEVCDSILQKSKKYRSSLKAKNPHQKLVDFDAQLIDHIVTTYQRQIRLKHLDYKTAAEYVVASIQNIPYTLVHTYSHIDAENPATYIKEGMTAAVANNVAQSIQEAHQKRKATQPLDQVGGCLENVFHYGVVSPLEMFLNQMGDCDSRATALYLVLKKLGYDVLELGSDVEGHALLAIHLPQADGNIYYKYRGKKYYIWETTFFHPTQSRVGVHADGLRYMKSWHLWEVALS